MSKKEKRRTLHAAREAARAAGASTYQTPAACRRGHLQAVWYVSSNNCVRCSRINQANRDKRIRTAAEPRPSLRLGRGWVVIEELTP
jgi:hypothetical protein